jgi:hypothetical protein
MRLLDRSAPQNEGALRTVRQMLPEVQSLSDPVVAATAALIAGIAIGFALASLLAGKDDEIKRLRTDADELKQRIEKLAG